MDRTWVVEFSLGLNPSRESSGIPKFSGVSEIGDFRQDKAENSDQIWMLQVFGKVFSYLQRGF